MSLASVIATDPVSLFMPGASVEERQLRQRLHNARVIASVRAVACASDNGRQLYWMVNRVASAWVFAPAHPEDLKEIADGLVRLFTVAGMFERIEGGAA